MFNHSRRKLLKGFTYGSALIVGGMSTVAFALSNNKKETAVSAIAGSTLPTSDISIMQQHALGKEIVTLINHTDNAITLDSITPIGLEHINGSLVVKVNKGSDGAVIMQAGERLSFEVEAISTQIINDSSPIPNVLTGHLKINSDHAAFNGIIPVTIFDSQVA